jgi:hypothetical protein
MKSEPQWLGSKVMEDEADNGGRDGLEETGQPSERERLWVEEEKV